MQEKLGGTRRVALYTKPQSNKRRSSQNLSSESKAPTRLGCGFKADQFALNFVLKFSSPFLWMQDRSYDEMSEEGRLFERSMVLKTGHNWTFMELVLL